MIGRKEEQKMLNKLLADTQSTVLFLTGRYRLGKSTLVRECYKHRIIFELTGWKDASMQAQLIRFGMELKRQFPSAAHQAIPTRWEEALSQLTEAIQEREAEEKQVIFLDEASWLAGKRAGFMEALLRWWSRIAHREELVLVVCSSQVNWTLGQQAKWTQEGIKASVCQLHPFTLAETREFLQQRNVRPTNYQLLLLYMAMGGIPAYLAHIQEDRSAGESIQALFFEQKGELRSEFQALQTLFFDRKGYAARLLTFLAGNASGCTRKEILDALKEKDGGWLTTLLADLEASGFIRVLSPLHKRKKETLYRLADLYVLFHLNFIAQLSPKANAQWNPMQQAALYKRWSGYAFENVCLAHLPQIVRRMGISGLQRRLASHVSESESVRCESLLDRRDGILNVVRCYFHADHLSITVSETFELNRIKEALHTSAKPGTEVQFIGISPYGIDDPADIFQEQPEIDCLFEA